MVCVGDGESKKRGGKNIKRSLSPRSLQTIISKVYKKPTCLYIEFFTCLLNHKLYCNLIQYLPMYSSRSLCPERRKTKKKKKITKREKINDCQSEQMGIKGGKGETGCL